MPRARLAPRHTHAVSPVLDNLPYPLVYAVFFLGAMVRANATYWLGRGARSGGGNTRAGRRLNNPVVRHAETVIARFGAPAVALSFLTVGVQTALNFAAGVLRMPWWRYEVGAVLGALMWAGIYSTIGFAVFGAWVGESPWAWVLAAVALVGLVALATTLTSRRLDQAPPYAALPPSESTPRTSSREGRRCTRWIG